MSLDVEGRVGEHMDRGILIRINNLGEEGTSRVHKRRVVDAKLDSGAHSFVLGQVACHSRTCVGSYRTACSGESLLYPHTLFLAIEAFWAKACPDRVRSPLSLLAAILGIELEAEPNSLKSGFLATSIVTVIPRSSDLVNVAQERQSTVRVDWCVTVHDIIIVGVSCSVLYLESIHCFLDVFWGVASCFKAFICGQQKLPDCAPLLLRSSLF